MKLTITTIFIYAIQLTTAQDAVSIGAQSTGSFLGGIGTSIGSTLTGFLPSFPSLPGLSMGSLPCVGLTTLSTGTCAAADACDATGGKGDSGCLTGGQVCCIPSIKCGATIAAADAWITNNEFPNGTMSPQNCVYTINKASPVVAQLKIELDSVTLAGPSPTGSCSDDRLVVEGVQGINVFPLCGSSSGSHIILPFNGASFALRVVVSGTGSIERKWRIHLTQVAHNTAAIAPAGCTQIFSTDGTLTSLNAGVGGLKYAVCFQKAPGTCGLRIDASSLLQARAPAPQPQLAPHPQLAPQPQFAPQSQLASVPQQAVDNQQQLQIVNGQVVQRLSKRQVQLPTLIRGNEIKTDPKTGDVTATSDILNLSLLGRNLLDINKQVVVPGNNVQQPQAPAPVQVQSVPIQKFAPPPPPKPMTPHYYGGRYYPHVVNPVPAYSAPLSVPSVPTPEPVKNVFVVQQSSPLPLAAPAAVEKSLTIGAALPGLLGLNNTLTTGLRTDLLPQLIPAANTAPQLTLPSLALPTLAPLAPLPSLTLPQLPSLALPSLVPTRIEGNNQTGQQTATSSLFNLGLLGQPLLGITKDVKVDNAVPITEPINSIRSRRQEPNLCHEYIFLAPNTLLCVEPGKYNGPAEIILTTSPLVAYIESSSSAAVGNSWKLPFSFIPC